MSNVREFGAAGDGRHDDTQAIQHAVEAGDGTLEFPRGVYRISRTIEIVLKESGPFSIDGRGGTASVVMTSAGPAFRLLGTHDGTGDPWTMQPGVWASERMPSLSQILIESEHPEADGVELIGTLQAVIAGVLIRRVRHGVRLHKRNRNVLISHCHIFDNTGVGVFLDHVNLHQINIVGSHISYNRLGGIRVEGSEVRNLQITGNDIEYNNHRSHRTPPEPTAEIYIDTTEEGSSVEEVAVASNTIQATVSPGGANIRIVEVPGKDRPPGLWTIAGNIIGSQENNVYLTGCHGVVISGNVIYSCGNRNLLIERSSQINIGGNMFRRHTEEMHTGLRLVESADCLIHGCTVQDESPNGQMTNASLLELVDCRRINVTGCQFLDGVPYGIDVERSSQINISACTVMDTRAEKRSSGAVRFTGAGAANLLSANTLGKDGESLKLDEAANVTVANNVVA